MKTISIKWSTVDVLSVRPDLTEQQANKVLDALYNRHDATIGINWDVIENTADDMFPKKDQDVSNRVGVNK